MTSAASGCSNLSEANKLVIILRSREFDRHSRDFLASHPHAVVVHIVCDLYSRFERVDDGLVEWYDLDLPQVIALRRKLIGDEGPALSNVEGDRYHLLGCSVLDHDWQEWVHQPLRATGPISCSWPKVSSCT